MANWEIDIDIPEWDDIIGNARDVVDEAGARIAKLVVDRTQSGLDKDGKPLPIPKDGGQPLKRSGQLIDSIHWGGVSSSAKKPSGTVRMRSPRQSPAGTRARQPNNPGLGVILGNEGTHPNKDTGPRRFMDVSNEVREEVVRRAADELAFDLEAARTTRVKK